MNRRSLSRVLILASAMVLGGCGLTGAQKTGIAGFAGATSDLAGVARQEFIDGRAEAIKMNSLRVALGDDAVDEEELEGKLTVEVVEVRVQAIDALKEYADLLQTLATSSQQAEMAAAAKNFSTSLKGIERLGISDAKADAIAAAVEAAGTLLIEQIRADAVRKVVMESDAPVRKILSLIEQDFDPESTHWQLGYVVVAAALKGRADDLLSDLPADAAQRVQIGEARTLAITNRDRFEAISKQIIAVVSKTKEAQISLKAAVQSRAVSVDDLDVYVGYMQKFISLYQVLKAKP